MTREHLRFYESLPGFGFPIRIKENPSRSFCHLRNCGEVALIWINIAIQFALFSLPDLDCGRSDLVATISIIVIQEV